MTELKEIGLRDGASACRHDNQTVHAIVRPLKFRLFAKWFSIIGTTRLLHAKFAKRRSTGPSMSADSPWA